MTRPTRLAAVSAFLLGCSADPATQVAPDFPEGSGQPGAVAIHYPSGPYGLGVGSTIADLAFLGFPDPGLYVADDDVSELRLSDFYNPTGHEIFPDGSPYSERAKPTALIIDACTVWCQPCGFHADTIFPAMLQTYRPMGGEILLALAEDEYGVPTQISDLREWAASYQVDYPSAIDPFQEMFAFAEEWAYPNLTLVRTKDMKVIAKKVGALQSSDPDFMDLFEKVMAGEPVLPEDGD